MGIRGRDTLTISGGEITVNSKGDALQANNGDDPEKGRITLTGGSFNLTSLKDGIQAESKLTISGGDYTLYTGGITSDKDPLQNENWQKSDSSGDTAGKGLKAGSLINITGGTFKLYCSDDAISTKGTIFIKDGTVDIATRDDGLRADKSVEIGGGKLSFLTCSKGINSVDILISGGTVNMNALNDGINSSACSTKESAAGESAQNGTAAMVSPTVRIAGGDVTIKAMGDCIDSKGSVILEGGTLNVSGSDSCKSDAVNFADSFLVDGSRLCASGSSGLVKAPGPNSKQPSLLISFSVPIKQGSKVVLADESGKEMLACTPVQGFQAILLSTPDMAIGKSYTLKVNGEKVLTAELTGTVTSITQGAELPEN